MANTNHHVQITLPITNAENQRQTSKDQQLDYSKRAQWLRAAVLGANDGLVSIASLMMGVGAVKNDIKAMILTGFAGLFAGACSMAIGEFVSVYSQYDIEVSQLKREKQNASSHVETGRKSEEESDESESDLPNPFQASAASALAFSLGAIVPIVSAAFVSDYKVRIGAVLVATTLALIGFGWVGSVLGKIRVLRSCARVVVGGWLAMGITFGLTKLIGSSGLGM